jgi:hypothetical protein
MRVAGEYSLLTTQACEVKVWSCRSSWRDLGRPFTKGYAKKEGRQPALDPGPREMWRTGTSLSNDQEWEGLSGCIEMMDKFGAWFNTKILGDDMWVPLLFVQTYCLWWIITV